jgi:uncharacterized protein (DUF1778 family)
MPTPAKSERLEARVTPEQKELIQRAAELTGRSVTEFLVSSAEAEARRTIREQALITLSVRDGLAFAGAILDPPAPGARLRAAARRHREVTRDRVAAG